MWRHSRIVRLLAFEDWWCVEILIEAGANVNHKSINETTPTAEAVINNHPDIVECLYGQGGELPEKYHVHLLLAALHDKPDLIRVLSKDNRVNINYQLEN